ncbi:hypothetical protein BDV25DRAFT_12029 [Aspergillus avenaceus]|uniref:Uncharacterized protein n=1 Tax=Aspergillus avenaceus TaxID=36643 RepID=A0A5N6TR01_ASPAV|nr:hypothetical protein BDV25DRAFT_12029 [Aspergillus avenaceus]
MGMTYFYLVYIYIFSSLISNDLGFGEYLSIHFFDSFHFFSSDSSSFPLQSVPLFYFYRVGLVCSVFAFEL